MQYSVISFPSLGLEINPARSFEIGPLTVHYYGLIIAAGLLLAVIYGCRRCKEFGIKEDDLLDMVLVGLPAGIMGVYISINTLCDMGATCCNVLGDIACSVAMKETCKLNK